MKIFLLICCTIMIAGITAPQPVYAGGKVFWQGLGEHITPQCGRNMPCGRYIPDRRVQRPLLSQRYGNRFQRPRYQQRRGSVNLERIIVGAFIGAIMHQSRGYNQSRRHYTGHRRYISGGQKRSGRVRASCEVGDITLPNGKCARYITGKN